MWTFTGVIEEVRWFPVSPTAFRSLDIDSELGIDNTHCNLFQTRNAISKMYIELSSILPRLARKRFSLFQKYRVVIVRETIRLISVSITRAPATRSN